MGRRTSPAHRRCIRGRDSLGVSSRPRLGPVYAHNRDHDALTKKVLSETIAATLGDSAVADITLIVAEGQPVHVILTASQGADLLVVGSRGRGGFAGLVLGSVSQHCVQHAPCPVVVIPPEDWDKG